MKKIFYGIAAVCAAMTFTACSSSDDSYNKYADKNYGMAAIDAGDNLNSQLSAAYRKMQNDDQDATKNAELKALVTNVVNNVIIPTYTQLGDEAENMQQALGNIDVNNLTQAQIDECCRAFKAARKLWEQSEAFLGGAASDKDIDPHIDSWPLNRVDLHTLLLNLQNTGKVAEDLDESVLGFHALEFILFRDGKNRTVADFQGKDTYKGFTDIKGSTELKYAETVLEDLVAHVYALQCSWEGQTAGNAERYSKADALGLNDGLTTEKGKSYGWNMLNAGDAQSTFADFSEVAQQLLSMAEGSCAGICDEVASKKIARPFSGGDVSYVESPFSYNSISDFADNIRSINNIWYGKMGGSAVNMAENSFAAYFSKYYPNTSATVSTAIINMIAKIEAMPYPFVKYCETINGKKYEDSELVEYDE